MTKQYEVVRHQGDATVYRLKSGRAEVLIYDKAGVTVDEIVARCIAAERELEPGHHALYPDDDPTAWYRPYKRFQGCADGIAICDSDDNWVMIHDEDCQFVGEALLSRSRSWDARKKVADLEAALAEAKEEWRQSEGQE